MEAGAIYALYAGELKGKSPGPGRFLSGRTQPGAKAPLISEENSPAERLQAEEWGEKTAHISGDLGRKKAFDPNTALISAWISGIRRADAWETRSKLHIEAKIALR
jgi:hypothetical protein